MLASLRPTDRGITASLWTPKQIHLTNQRLEATLTLCLRDRGEAV
jgi:hypothetical protein